MEFESFIEWVTFNLEDYQQFTTLGDRAYFFAKYDGYLDTMFIKTRTYRGKNPDGYKLTKDQIETIFDRCMDAPADLRFKTSYYLLPPSVKEYDRGKFQDYWRKPPDKIATPGIPAIIKYWIENR